MTNENQQVKEALSAIDSMVKASIESVDNKIEISASAAKELNDKVLAMSDQILELEQKGTPINSMTDAQTVGLQFVESSAFNTFKSGGANKATFKVENAVIGTPDTVVPDRLPGVIGPAQRILRIEDLIATGQTNSSSVIYPRENVFTNAAATKAEGQVSYAESDITFTTETANVALIGHYLPISKQLMEDAPALASYIDGRLQYGLLLKKETQLLSGTGTGTDISGFLNTGNHAVFTPEPGSNVLENIRRAMTLVFAAEYQANGIVLNPVDVEALDLDKGTDEHFRSPFAANPWGLSVVKSNSIPAGTFLLGDFKMASQIFNRKGAELSMSEHDGDNFKQDMVTVKAALRAALAIYAPAALISGKLTA